MCQFCYGESEAYSYQTFTAQPGINQGFDAIPQSSIQAMVGGYWSSPGQAATVSYSFSGSNSLEVRGSFGGAVNQLSSNDQAMVESMLQQYSNVANLNFQEVSGDANINIRNEYISSSVGGYANIPRPNAQVGVTLDTQLGAIGQQGTAYYAAIHELGHAMGMYHPFYEQGGLTATRNGLTNAENSPYYTVMSYSNNNKLLGEIAGLQLNDIAIMQYLYGANHNYNSGDTVYTFDYSGTSQRYALWDGGDNANSGGQGDTFYVDSSYTGNVTIDLRDGDYLNVIGVEKFMIAYNATIENAIAANGSDSIRGNELDNYLYGGRGVDTIHGDAGNDVIFGGNGASDSRDSQDFIRGGDGNDIIYGNAGNDTLVGGDAYTDTTDGADTLFGGNGDDYIYGNAGNDVIVGASGDDMLYGGVGDDTYVIGWGNDLDIIYGFEGAGRSGGDVIQIYKNANNSGINNYADLMAQAITVDGEHAGFLLNGNAIIVADHLPSSFSEDDFVFV